MTCLIATQVIGDGAMTVYLVNETTLRQRLLPPEHWAAPLPTWKVASGSLMLTGALVGAALAKKSACGRRWSCWPSASVSAPAFSRSRAGRSPLYRRALAISAAAPS